MELNLTFDQVETMRGVLGQVIDELGLEGDALDTVNEIYTKLVETNVETMAYDVVIYETVMHRVTVDARDRNHAYEVAYEIITNGPASEYETESDGFTGDWSATLN